MATSMERSAERLICIAGRIMFNGPRHAICTGRRILRPRLPAPYILPTRLLATMVACLPCYSVSADNIEILHEPSAFYQTLKNEISSATSRITMAALYLGSDSLEKELVQSLQDKMSQSVVCFTILLDHSRGTRGVANSCTMLQTLVDNFPQRVAVALYHTPHLRGLLKAYLPGRLTESVGLNHIKVFIFDDNVLISGANLSESYFTNRQDRYIMIRDSPGLASFFDQLVKTIGTFSMELKKGGEIAPHPDCPAHPYADEQEKFLLESRRRIMAFIQSNLPTPTSKDLISMSKLELGREMENLTDISEVEAESESSVDACDTVIYPLIQMGPLGVHFDELAFSSVLERAPQASTIYLASGYFNLTDEYINQMLHKSLATYRILSASPEVNGFYGARGVAGAIPDVYTEVSKQFCDKLERSNVERNRIKLYEYYRSRWTFHVKGLWYYPPGEPLPAMSMIGSPNFGYRSVYRDLEAQISIVTRNQNLRERLHDEKERIYKWSSEVSRATFESVERRVPMWVRIGTHFLKSFF